MDESIEFILDFLKENEIPMMGPKEEITERLLGKLTDHDLPLTKCNLKLIINEYGDEVLNPLNDVLFDEDKY